MSRLNVRDSAYGDYVSEAVAQLARQGGGTYTIDDLAAVLGLHVTPNFRKRIRTLVADCRVICHFPGVADTSRKYKYIVIPEADLNWERPF